MDTVYPHCAGLDVHKDTVVAGVRHHDSGKRTRQEVRTSMPTSRPLARRALATTVSLCTSRPAQRG